MKYDIAIVGGGMVGAAFACALAHTPLRIALIDAKGLQGHGTDHRLIALNYASGEFFKKISIWNHLVSHASIIQQVHISNRGHFGTTRLCAIEMDVEQLGSVVPASEINQALYKKLSEVENVNILRNTKLSHLSQHSDHVNLTLHQESGANAHLQAAIVIGADGSFSTVRDLVHIPTQTIDYKQKALVTITQLRRNHHQIAYERFLANGAIAMLPLTEQRVATIWSGEENYIDDLLTTSDAHFLELLQNHFGYRLGKLLKTQQRYAYPLKFIKAQEQIKNRVILIGNAAHTIHPIAAQGLNLALHEVDVLTQHLLKRLSLENLSPFFKNQNFNLNLSHRLAQLFSVDFFALNSAKQLGMIGLDMCASAKKRFGKKMIGFKSLA